MSPAGSALDRTGLAALNQSSNHGLRVNLPRDPTEWDSCLLDDGNRGNFRNVSVLRNLNDE
jgi:hypothetical protein